MMAKFRSEFFSLRKSQNFCISQLRHVVLAEHLVDLLRFSKELRTIVDLIDTSLISIHKRFVWANSKACLAKTIKKNVGKNNLDSSLFRNRSISIISDLAYLIFSERPLIATFLGRWRRCSTNGKKIGHSFFLGDSFFVSDGISLSFKKDVSPQEIARFKLTMKDFSCLKVALEYSSKSRLNLNHAVLAKTSFLKEGARQVTILDF